MATVQSITEKLEEGLKLLGWKNPNNTRLEKFALDHVNKSGKELDISILQFMNSFFSLLSSSSIKEKYEKDGYEKTVLFIYEKKENSNVPSFIFDNLLLMPANRGYLWRGIRYWGKLPADLRPNKVLYEPRNKRTLIHTWSSSGYRLQERKKGARYKTLLKSVTKEKTVLEKVEEKGKKEKKEKKENVEEQKEINKYSVLYLSDSD